MWLTPEQVKIIPVGERFNEYAIELLEVLKNSDIRALLDLRAEKVGKKIREAELEKIPYMLIVGEEEVANNTVSVRKQGEGGDLGTMSVEDFVNHINSEVRKMLKQ